MRHGVIFWTSAIALMSVASGCGGGGADSYEGPKRASIKGKVTFDGAPVDGGVIAFVGHSGDSQRKSGGPIVNGEYDIPEAKGPNAGHYRVEILWPKPTGQKVKDPDTGAETDLKRNVIPDKYNANSELIRDISAGENVLDFELPK